MTNEPDAPVTRSDFDALIAEAWAVRPDGPHEGRGAASIARELAAALAAERARADQAEQDADAHARDTQFEREGRRKAEQRIADALAIADEAGTMNWEEDNYAAGAQDVAAALSAEQ